MKEMQKTSNVQKQFNAHQGSWSGASGVRSGRIPLVEQLVPYHSCSKPTRKKGNITL
jgi:hypothetical protein